MFRQVSIPKWGAKSEKIDLFQNPSCKIKNIASMVYPHPIGPHEKGLMVPEFKGLFGHFLNSVRKKLKTFKKLGFFAFGDLFGTSTVPFHHFYQIYILTM